MLKSFGQLIGTLTQNQGGGCIRSQVSFIIRSLPIPQRDQDLSTCPLCAALQQSLAAWFNMQLSGYRGGGTSLTGNHRAAPHQISMT